MRDERMDILLDIPQILDKVSVLQLAALLRVLFEVHIRNDGAPLSQSKRDRGHRYWISLVLLRKPLELNSRDVIERKQGKRSEKRDRIVKSV